jgi:glycosyltransferase involved in cell wall biosynthesis
MRILLISGEFPPMQGGVGDYTQEMARAFADLGHDVWVLVARSVPQPESASHSPLWKVIPQIDDWKWGCWPQILAVVREIQPQVINVQYQAAAYDMRVPAINLLPWRLRGVHDAPPIVTTFHDLQPPYLFPKAGPLRAWVVRMLARGSDAAIFTNAEDVHVASRWFLRAASTARNAKQPAIHQIPIGSNIAVAPPAGFDRAAWRAQHGYRPGDFLWAYFGFLNESKGGETLIRALAQAPRDTHLLMIGGRVGSSDPTNQAYAARVEALISQFGLQKRVRWTGYTPPDQVSAALLSADILALPYRDGVSFRRGSLHAALAHGCAIVSTLPRVPISELGHGQNILLVPAEAPEALAQAALLLRQDPVLLARLAQGAGELARQFSWPEIARRTIAEVFEPVVSRRAP